MEGWIIERLFNVESLWIVNQQISERSRATKGLASALYHLAIDASRRARSTHRTDSISLVTGALSKPPTSSPIYSIYHNWMTCLSFWPHGNELSCDRTLFSSLNRILLYIFSDPSLRFFVMSSFASPSCQPRLHARIRNMWPNMVIQLWRYWSLLWS